MKKTSKLTTGTDRQTDRQTDRHTDRKTDIQTERQIEERTNGQLGSYLWFHNENLQDSNMSAHKKNFKPNIRLAHGTRFL